MSQDEFSSVIAPHRPVHNKTVVHLPSDKLRTEAYTAPAVAAETEVWEAPMLPSKKRPWLLLICAGALIGGAVFTLGKTLEWW